MCWFGVGILLVAYICRTLATKAIHRAWVYLANKDRLGKNYNVACLMGVTHTNKIMFSLLDKYNVSPSQELRHEVHAIGQYINIWSKTRWWRFSHTVLKHVLKTFKLCPYFFHLYAKFISMSHSITCRDLNTMYQLHIRLLQIEYLCDRFIKKKVSWVWIFDKKYCL